MADTRQVVSWSVQRECIFRNGDNWFLPKNTFRPLQDLRTVASGFTDDRVVDGICVTSWTTGGDNSGKCYDIPFDGFRIEDRLGKFGGLSEALKLCTNCEANAENKLDTKVAGCFGYLDIWPDSPELEKQLSQIIKTQNLGDRLRSAFSITTPLWYGLLKVDSCCEIRPQASPAMWITSQT